MCALFVRIKQLRVAQGLSQAELAARAGVRRATVSRIENAQVSGIDFYVLERLADVLGVEPGMLISRKSPAGAAPALEPPPGRRPPQPRSRRRSPRRSDGAT